MPALTRQTFQHGSLTTEPRSNGNDVWVFRWRESGPDGTRIRRKVIVGTKRDYPTRAKAEKAAAALRLEISKEQPERVKSSLTVADLAVHYCANELDEQASTKAYSTRCCYLNAIQNYILPRWGTYRLGDVRTVAVEGWLHGLDIANGTKAKVRNVFHVLFSHAERYEWHDRNPITKARQSAKRRRDPDILDPAELTRLLMALPEPFKTMVFVAAGTGLRRGELIGLKWSDVDFDAALIHPKRSIVNQHIGNLKTLASAKPVALDPYLGMALASLQSQSPFNGAENWVFASPASAGKKPYWPDMVLRRRVKPTALAVGIVKRIGWHSFRHTYASLLKASGADVKVVQESLRHANARITMDLYTQALTPDKRLAQSKVIEMVRPKLALPAVAAG